MFVGQFSIMTTGAALSSALRSEPPAGDRPKRTLPALRSSRIAARRTESAARLA
jgi:hypothetical protein